jgi:hypothetical protein
MDKDTAKLIVKILAILSFIGAATMLIGGLMMMFGGSFLAAFIPLGVLSGALGFLAAAAGIVLVALGVLELFVGLGLWKFKNWARIVSIVFAVIGLAGWPSGTIFGAVIIYLLAFNKDIKALFKK